MSDNLQPRGSDETTLAQPLYTPIKRRSFFMYAGATAGATALVLAGCSKDSDPVMNSNLVTLGTGDFRVLNYAYALEQLEAAFYTTLRDGAYYKGLAAASAEKQILDDLYYHEVIHREFFKAALGTNAIKPLTPNFGAINMADRASVLGAARTFEDLGVAAYNGAGQFLESPLFLTIAGKIVSVEARHAAIIRDLLAESTFVGNDVVTLTENTSLERSKTPTEVVAAANGFLAEGSKIDASSLR
ncbi:ferritin-like domain-containing protein [Hymenobacter sp. B1770]|uniref:ferritin-like domain-containing protein n=1 Tax=Hymenobacter sp. B1770 TaxID=1718788 RepID=UPI003CEF9B3C